ncbi:MULTISPECIES: hypothetical protein [unclassified Bradyrhizobium]|jgi:hypothetical protein|uniref:hypothetical protein n=1 Tax=unclassified Bradyrhizobium TaxID=2631580 RepID=UPI001FF740C2|nr:MULTISPECIES: hypothetical protein [unclassified Bradyrhizobium]MCK1519530.1 hypothetical protein [Bradyrhizobium sp. 17]UPJ70068.1 hypothetical protein IVB19_20305 [Bradyrhizobium sp. 187]
MDSGGAVEFVKLFGGLSGICSVAFLILEKFTKHYPVAFIEARPLIDGSRNIVPFLYLKNVSERPILISWPDGDLSRFRVARDDSIDGILATMFEGETTISLSAGADAVLPLHRPRSYEEIDPENVLEWIATWQLAQPILWRTPRKLRVQIRKRDFEALIDGYVAKH